MLGSLVDLVVGDSRKPERSARAPDVPMLSHFLGYRSFDEEKRIFHQVRSKGFILELAPLVGANDRISGNVSVSYVLETFAEANGPGAAVSRIALANIRKVR